MTLPITLLISSRLSHTQSPNDIKGCTLLDPFDELSKHFSSPPLKYIHFIVEPPPPGTPAKRRALGDVDSIETTPSKRRRIASSPSPPGNAARRDGTVRALFERLETYKFIQVRGTTAGGKTTLGQLLSQHICGEDPTIKIIWLNDWPEKEVKESGGYCQFLPKKGWVEGEKTVFIFDEAQLSKWDEDLWRSFFRDIDRYPNRRAITLESYGSATSRMYISGTPFQLRRAQRVTLAAIDHEDGIPAVGLLFTREEVDDYISVFIPESENYFHASFFDDLVNLTKGHVGAIKDFVQTIMAHPSYGKVKKHPRQLYFWDTFLSSVGPRWLLSKLKDSSAFGRGLPEDDDIQDPVVAEIFYAVLCNGHVTHKSITDLPSSLHRWFTEWKLCDSLPTVSFETGDILNFVINVISIFSSRELGTGTRIASGGVQRPPEAQYQAEFYRCCNLFSKGSITSFPEYGTEAGRVDFFIPVKGWGIELLRDGDRLAQHSGRFSNSGSYATDLACSDHIIFDFRKTVPRDPHPHLQKLYHVVLSDDFLNVRILDNKLREVQGGRIRLLASS